MSTCNIQGEEPDGNMSWTCEFGAWREAKLVIEVCEFQHLYSFPRAAVIKNHNLGDLKQQKFILSESWGLEAQYQGISMVGSYWKL